MLGTRIAKDLVRLEVDGGLNGRACPLGPALRGSQRPCVPGSQSPEHAEESERQALIDQQDNPLVAKVASELQQRIDAQDTKSWPAGHLWNCTADPSHPGQLIPCVCCVPAERCAGPQGLDLLLTATHGDQAAAKAEKARSSKRCIAPCSSRPPPLEPCRSPAVPSSAWTARNQLTFEARGQRWFASVPAAARARFRCRTPAANTRVTGPAAEEHLAGLLGVDGILSSRQAGKTLPGRWAHLWVMQGLAGDNPLATDRYDLHGLLEQLEQRGGAVIQQSRLDQLASQFLEAALAEQYTPWR